MFYFSQYNVVARNVLRNSILPLFWSRITSHRLRKVRQLFSYNSCEKKTSKFKSSGIHHGKQVQSVICFCLYCIL